MRIQDFERGNKAAVKVGLVNSLYKSYVGGKQKRATAFLNPLLYCHLSMNWSYMYSSVSNEYE